MSRFRLISLLCVALALAACGGGSSTEQAMPSTGNNVPVTAPETMSDQPNILLIIADDQGLDSSAQYSLSDNPPVTPTIDALAVEGIVFDNVWATPACTTTRSTIITGQYGVSSGVLDIGDELPADSLTLQRFLASYEDSADYQSAVIGKWHLGGAGTNANYPSTVGIDYYAGSLSGSIPDYRDWDLTINGVTTNSNQYHTSAITDLAIDWIDQQSQPWFLWLAYVAPHTPFHLPPENLHTQTLSGTEEDISANPRAYYLAAIEAMDSEIGRLLSGMTDAERENTVIIYLGDNGTPGRAVDPSVYAERTKGSFTEGGLRVPMVVSGKGVTRQNVREDALVNSVDLFATIAELAGSSVTEVENSLSFASLLGTEGAALREYLYSDFEGDSVSGWTVRDTRYKLVALVSGQRELYDLSTDPTESTSLLAGSGDYAATVERLAAVATAIRQVDSGGEEGGGETLVIYITGEIFTRRSGNCQDYIDAYQATSMDVFRSVLFTANLTISGSAGKCIFRSNGVPNHDFNDGQQGFPNDLTEQSYYYEISASPSFAPAPTELAIGDDNGLMLNGVKIDLLAAACFGVGDEKTGCGNMNQPWRFDPMFPANGFRVDSHNAHVQPNGSYHYHGTPNAMFDADMPVESPVIGFAADGFPIFGSWFNDDGTIRKAQTSYRLREGQRAPVSGYATPAGDYDGTFRDDYEYVAGLGDLDQCNGMQVDGVYGYFITEQYPYIMACLKGQMDATFE